MTVLTGPTTGTAARPARAYAIVTWAYAAGFGIPTVPVAVYLVRHGKLPWFGGLFPMYGGPWSDQLEDSQFVGSLLGYVGLLVAVAGTAGRVRRGSRRAAVLSLGLLPVEAVFWLGFALPIPWIFGAARAALLAAAWRQLRDPHTKKEISHA